MLKKELKPLLDSLYEKYNRMDFIPDDPISIPHAFKEKQDIEISGLFAAIFAWGQRKTILNKCNFLLERMDNSPYDFILNHTKSDLEPFKDFVHRTFNFVDLQYFCTFLKHHYTEHSSLETLFVKGMLPGDKDMGNGLSTFRKEFFSLEHHKRTEKHVSSPLSNSACKRINMYLRWMVRKDAYGVDFGIWKQIKPSQLLCPLDVHVIRIAQEFGLLHTDKANWNTCLELTDKLRKLDPTDPVKYDFALFGYGVENK